jgi:glycosyltransferase involved in cell wall biosynthesis
MRILILTGIFPPEVGGPAIYAEKISEKLHRKEISVSVFYYSNGFVEKKYDFPVKRISKKYPTLFRNFISIFILLKPIIENDIIYVLSSSPGIALLPMILGRLLRKKIFIRPGADYLWDKSMSVDKNNLGILEYYDSNYFKKNKPLYLIFKFLIKNVSGIIFPTVFLKDIYVKHYKIKKEKTAVIDYPFPEIDYKPVVPVDPKQIIYAGRLVPVKNIPRLIEAFSELSEKEVILKIIGEGPQKKSLIEKAEKLGIGQKVIFTGAFSQEKLLREIRESYMVVIPSIFEAGSFLALECIKLNIPILFTKQAGLYDFFKDKLIFIDPFNVQDIKKKIEYLLKRENWLEYKQKLSRIDVSRNWSDVADEHIRFFKSI